MDGQYTGSHWMSLNSKKVTGIRVLDIAEEGALAIETMVNKVIQEMHQQKTPIIDIQVTDTNCFLILGEKNADWSGWSSSVGRVSASQAECRGFESRLPLFNKIEINYLNNAYH